MLPLMRTLLVLFGLLVVMGEGCLAQVCGCTDSLAINYDADATVNDGSCLYAPTTVYAVEVGNLDTLLNGTSSLFYWENGYWTYNDWSDNCLYRIDSVTAAITDTLCLDGVANNNTEEIAQDSLYLYFGVVGNNYGDRNDLHFLRIKKESILNQTLEIDTIWFSYEDQTDFSYGSYNTDFDCEAFIVTDDSIYLFTKQWVSEQTALYGIPKTPGTYVAQRRGTYDVQGLVTGATYVPEYQLVVLCGYDYNGGDYWTALHPFVVLLYDFQGDNFFSGNKRRLDFESLAKVQVEAIATTNALDYYLTNEHFATTALGVTVDVPARLQRLDLREYLVPYLSEYIDFGDTVSIPDGIPSPQNSADSFRIYPNPAKDKLHIACPPEFLGAEYAILNLHGQKVGEGILRENVILLDDKVLNSGKYILVIRGKERTRTFSFIRE